MSRDEELNLLIVDDEVLETEYILTLLSKTEFVFQNISVAFSMEAAQEILTNHAVDIILCDIEMPQGSGLDLLRWIREKKLPVEALIVTCHPEFSYAQQAMKLSSADYLLKPLDLTQLTQGLSRCVELLKQNLAAQDYLQNQEKMRDLLFQDLMQGDFFGKREELARQMQALRLNYDEGETLLSLYFRMDSSMSRGREGRALARKTVLLNVVQDILFDFKTRPLAFFPEEEAFFIAFQTKDLPDSLSIFYDVRLKRLLTSSHDLLHLPMACFVGLPVSFWELPRTCQNLREKCGQFFARWGAVCLPTTQTVPSKIWPDIQDSDWRLMLEHGSLSRLRREITSYCQELLERELVPAGEVFLFSQKLIRQVTRYLQEDHLNLEETLSEEQQQKLLMKDGFFLEDLVKSVNDLLDKLQQDQSQQQEGMLVIQRICKYISAHVEEDLDRQTLARTFGLSPEHLSRLFHQETGCSLVSFLTKTKLEFCRHMFQTTQCSVRQAAERVGYTNFSYFSKLFREYYGCTPQQYKEQLDQAPRDKNS